MLAEGWQVSGTARTAEARAAVLAAGAAPIDPSDAGAMAGIEPDAVLVAAPPTPEGCPGLAALKGSAAAWTGYLSTTGVYGDRGGGWVFEHSALLPTSPEGERRVRAERAWLDRGACVFRLPGIYGPGRSAFDRLRDGAAKRVVKPGQVFSRIHVEDLAAGLRVSIARPRAGGIYNLCDDEPAPADVVTAYAAALVGVEPPPAEPFDAAALSPAARRFWSENKRVSNALAKAELAWRPRFPSYREGLRAILKA